MYKDFLKTDPKRLPYTDLGVLGFPCIKFSSNNHGHTDYIVDVNDLTTRQMVEHLIACLTEHIWGLLAIECVGQFFKSRAWTMVLAAIRKTRYTVLAVLVADSQLMGLPQHRNRRP